MVREGRIVGGVFSGESETASAVGKAIAGVTVESVALVNAVDWCVLSITLPATVDTEHKKRIRNRLQIGYKPVADVPSILT